jgi:hypothetical protein
MIGLILSAVMLLSMIGAPQSGIGSPLEGRRGIIAQAVGHGSDYLAVPIGPGRLVRLCAVKCLTMVSTDAGPNRQKLKAGRIADVALGAWLTICGKPQSAGTCVGRWETVDELPATDAP